MIKTLEEDLARNQAKHQESIDELTCVVRTAFILFKSSFSAYRSQFQRQLRQVNELLTDATESRDATKRKLTAAQEQVRELFFKRQRQTDIELCRLRASPAPSPK